MQNSGGKENDANQDAKIITRNITTKFKLNFQLFPFYKVPEKNIIIVKMDPW